MNADAGVAAPVNADGGGASGSPVTGGDDGGAPSAPLDAGPAACTPEGGSAVDPTDAYLTYLETAPEYQPVPRDRSMLSARWNTWIYMPWRNAWDIGTGQAGGEFCQNNGINGGWVDANPVGGGLAAAPLSWLEQYHLQFYSDHSANKGYLYLRPVDYTAYYHDATAIRTGSSGYGSTTPAAQPVNDSLLQSCSSFLSSTVTTLTSATDLRVAYGMDDEVSWSSYVLPLAWRINDDDQAYSTWLTSYYGAGKAPPAQFVTPDSIAPQLGSTLAQLDFSPLLDRLSYNDSVWANTLGQLVQSANALDPTTPAGVTGQQSPNAFGGFDYAKLMKKLEWVEAYDLGSSQAIIRSFNPANAAPVVMTNFHSDPPGVSADIWEAWYYFAHGNRGLIGWVQDWFETDDAGVEPEPWIAEYAPTLKELGSTQGSKLVGATWIHDGVGIYYSHPSIQVSYALDIQPFGHNWPDRQYSDPELGTSHNVRKAWENILTDAGLEYSFVGYDEVATRGVPPEYKVLILPAAYALSDLEVARLRDYVACGGVVIADFAPALFDQHGKGRTKGGADDLFGVARDGASLTAKNFFGGALWVEADQQAALNFSSYEQLLGTVMPKMQAGYAIAEPSLSVTTAVSAGAGAANTSLVHAVGPGKAITLNLSPWRYLQYREQGTADATARAPFVQFLDATGVKPWVDVSGNDGSTLPHPEVTYFSRAGRTYVLVVQNAPISGGSAGVGLVDQQMNVTVSFHAPVHGVVDERSGRALGDGTSFTLPFRTVEAVFLSFAGDPPR